MSIEKNMLNEVNTIRKQMGLPYLTEHEEINLEVNQLIEEGAWENIKYALSKLGRYKAGGKIFGKSQTDAKSLAQITNLLDKKGNEVIKNLDIAIKQKNVEFPNNKSQEDFLNTILDIATIYDSIVAATKLTPEDEGYLPVDAANTIINDLREYTQKYLDVDLTAAFSIFNEGDELNEVDTDLDTIKSKVGSKFADTKASIESGDLKSYDTERMKTLKSWRLPLVLMGAGASFGALSWLIHYLFSPKEITTLTPEIIQDKVETALGNVNPGEGMTQILNRTLGTDLNPNSNPKEVVNALAKLGGGDAKKGVEIITQNGGIFKDSNAARQTLTAIINNPTEHGNTLKQVFSGTWAGTGRIAGDTLVTLPGNTLSGMVIKSITRWVSRKTIIGGVKATVAAPILKVLGISLITGGVVAALARYKGRKTSRAQVLNDLVQYIRPVESSQSNQSVINIGSGSSRVKGSSNNEQLYNNLKKYFQDIFNYKIQTNTSTYGTGGTSNKQKQYSGSSNVTSKITQPNDIDDIIKLMEVDLNFFNELKEVNDSLMRSINNKADAVDTDNKGLNDIGLSSNQLKLFKTHITRLTQLVKMFKGFNTTDKNLQKLIDQLRANPIFQNGIDVNTLLSSDSKSLKIFVSDFNKAVYATQFKNGNNIMDQLKKIGINKLSEAAIRTPGKSQANAVYNTRREFLKNYPNLIKSFYAVFSYLIDLAKNGKLNQQNTPNKNQTNNPNSNQNNQQNDTQPTFNQDNGTRQSADRNSIFWDPNDESTWVMTEDYELLETISIHNNLNQIIENVLNEFGENQPEMEKARLLGIDNSHTSRVLLQLTDMIPDISGKIANKYKEKYGETINRVKLNDYLQTIIGSLSKATKKEISSLINMDIRAYNKMIASLKTKESNPINTDTISPNFDPNTFLPDTVGNYDLSQVNKAARTALAQKAVEIISRQTDTTINQDNVIEVMRQLIDDINKNGQKQIPKI